MAETILQERHDGYHVITLNRPEKLNAFNTEMHEALKAAIEESAVTLDCRAIVLTGAGRGFCAGQDLSDRDPTMRGSAPDLGVTLQTYYNPLVRQLRSLRKPVICAVNGVAAGAGANVALSCDIVLAARSAKFIQAFSKIGLVPDSGGSYWLTHLLGEARAKGLALTGEPLAAETAAEWGMIWKAVDDENLMAEAQNLAVSLANGPATANGLIKEAIHHASTNSLNEQLDLERRLQRLAGQSDDYKEGVAAFLEKRPANFRKN